MAIPASRAALFGLAFVLLFLASIAPIQSYDAFWHLATGRWIVEHGGLPGRDPFGLASEPIPWHNGEWLFQIALYAAERAVGLAGISILRALAVAAFFTWLLRRVTRETSTPVAVLLVGLSYAGADLRLGVRPETAGVLLAGITLALLLERLTLRRVVIVALLTAVWINLHPSALLVPAIAALMAAGRWIAGDRESRVVRLQAASIGLPLLALLANPWGIEGILAPVRLTRFVSSGTFVNLEWLPTSPRTFPLVYVSIAAGFAALAWRRDRRFAAPALVLALFSALALRYVRNHGFFFVALPLLTASALPAVETRMLRIAAAVAAAAALISTPVRRGAGLGSDSELFPVAAVRQLERSGLRGNIYNPDQFGGYLIWRFYPERRVLTDGRNELYMDFLGHELPEAIRDNRGWFALFRKYELTLAVEEYRSGMIELKHVESGKTIRIPPSLGYFPREQWALIGFDDVAMVFARRDAYPAELLSRLEYRRLLPEIPAVDLRGATEERIRRDLERAEREGAGGWRLDAMREFAERQPRAR